MTADREDRIARVLAQYAGPEHAGLRMLIVELASDAGEIARRDALIATLTTRLDQIEEALGGAQRAGKRQAAPFSKKWPKTNPKTSGRKPGEDYGPKLAKDHEARLIVDHANICRAQQIASMRSPATTRGCRKQSGSRPAQTFVCAYETRPARPGCVALQIRYGFSLMGPPGDPTGT